MMSEPTTPEPKTPQPIGPEPDIAAAPKSTKLKRRMAVSRERVVTRLWRAAERQVTEIECRMVEIDEDPLGFERDAKMLAIIAKTVRDLVVIDAEAFAQSERIRLKEMSIPHGPNAAATETPPGHNTEADALGPRDIEEFRAELARRLDELRDERGGRDAS